MEKTYRVKFVGGPKHDEWAVVRDLSVRGAVMRPPSLWEVEAVSTEPLYPSVTYEPVRYFRVLDLRANCISEYYELEVAT